METDPRIQRRRDIVETQRIIMQLELKLEELEAALHIEELYLDSLLTAEYPNEII